MIVASPQSEDFDLLSSSQQMIAVVGARCRMLQLPFLVLMCLDDGFNLIKGHQFIRLFLASSLAFTISPLVFCLSFVFFFQTGILFLVLGHVWGDPCEFGLLSVLNSVWSRHPADKYGPHHAKDARLGQGIGTSFVWLAAQAHNQGQ